MDYFKLGEVYGKAWRLGHMGANENEQESACISAVYSVGLQGDFVETPNFTTGFRAGIEAVDAEAAQVKPASRVAPSDASEH